MQNIFYMNQRKILTTDNIFFLYLRYKFRMIRNVSLYLTMKTFKFMLMQIFALSFCYKIKI